MEKGIDGVFGRLRERFELPQQDIRTYSPLTLAYIGDGVYDLVIRSIVVGRGNARAGQLHRYTSHFVKAHSQSAMIASIRPLLSGEEEAVYRRGRNAHSPTMAKHATMGDYRRATGFEALMGYLYLTDRWERMLELIRVGLADLEQGAREQPGSEKR